MKTRRRIGCMDSRLDPISLSAGKKEGRSCLAYVWYGQKNLEVGQMEGKCCVAIQQCYLLAKTVKWYHHFKQCCRNSPISMVNTRETGRIPRKLLSVVRLSLCYSIEKA